MDLNILSLIIGAFLVLLTSLYFQEREEVRKWNVENISKIYAPLQSEFSHFRTYFLPASRVRPESKHGISEYAEERDILLKTDVWGQIKKEHLLYRIKLDDEDLYKSLVDYYSTLRWYKAKRVTLFQGSLLPFFYEIAKQFKGITKEKAFEHVRKVTKIKILDGFPQHLGALRYTPFVRVYHNFQKLVNISMPYHKFLEEVQNKIDKSTYEILLQHREILAKESRMILQKIEKKLKSASPS